MSVPYKGPVIRATFSCNLSHNNVVLQVDTVCWTYYHLPRAINFHFAKSKSNVFLQHENLLHEKVVIHETNHLNKVKILVTCRL